MKLFTVIIVLVSINLVNALSFNGSDILANDNHGGKNMSNNSNPHVDFYSIKASGIRATFMPYGARLTHLLVKDRDGNPQDVVVGYDKGDAYINDTDTVHSYFGAVVGRYANRIKKGTFEIDEETYHVPRNENNGTNTLHGGTVGYDQRNWTVTSYNESSITFMLEDNGYEGFPGSVITYATYAVKTRDRRPILTTRLVSIPLDGATPILLSNHIYWSLNAFTDARNPTVLNDTLSLPYSNRYIETDKFLVPTGDINLVQDKAGTDFIEAIELGTNIKQAVGGCGPKCTGLDTAFILDRPRYSGPESTDLVLLTLQSNKTGIKMELKTNQQSLQIYSCDGQDGTIPVKKSQQHGNDTTYLEQYGCVVIEPQQWIDGINNPQWAQNEFQVYGVDTQPAVNFALYEFSSFE